MRLACQEIDKLGLYASVMASSLVVGFYGKFGFEAMGRMESLWPNKHSAFIKALIDEDLPHRIKLDNSYGRVSGSQVPSGKETSSCVAGFPDFQPPTKSKVTIVPEAYRPPSATHLHSRQSILILTSPSSRRLADHIHTNYNNPAAMGLP